MNLPINDNNLPLIKFTQTKQQRLDSNQYAKLDPKTARIRERLARRLDQQEEQITKDALKQTKQKIHKWIQRHSSERKVIGNEPSSLFSGGNFAAEASPKIQAIRAQLAKGIEQTAQQIPASLKGRVSKS